MRRAARAVARPAATLDQTMPVEDGVNGALGRDPDIPVQPPDQEFADLARSPMRLLVLGLNDQGLDLRGQLICIAHRAPGSVTQRLQAVLLVPIKDLVAGLAGNAELPAHIGHSLAFEKAGDETQAFFHDRTRSPRHLHLPQNKSGKCNPCVRYVLSPMSRAAHSQSLILLAALAMYHRPDTRPRALVRASQPV